MSMQNESRDTGGLHHQGTRDGTTSNAGGVATGDSGATGGQAANPGSQQSGQQSNHQRPMPPSETDDDQYDQGTVQQAP